MASLLASLTEHYDRCSLALKAAEAGMPVDPDLFLVLSRDAVERFQLELAACMDGLRDFEHRQTELKADMEVRLDELWQLGEFYDGFVGAYDEMILEVGRRRGVEARMETIVRDADTMLAELYDGWSFPSPQLPSAHV